METNLQPSSPALCPNCGLEQDSNFCGNCGQRMNVKRITFKEAFFDFWSRIYGFDSIFPRTLRDLTLRPGQVAARYIQRNRALYYGPVGYFFLMVTVFLLALSIFNIDIKDFLTQNQQAIGFDAARPGSTQDKMNRQILDVVGSNMRLIAFLIIPFNGLAARYLFFRKSGLNFLEHTVLPFYLIGHVYWLSILSVLLYLVTGSFMINNIISVVTLFYFGFGYLTLIDNQAKWKRFLKGVGVYIVGQLLFVTIMVILIVIGLLIAYQINPEAVKALKGS
jgi:hypothetical protein